ncbi:MAG: DNA gyrase/topoisomerase IV subunit B, partial [bacterium]
MSTPEAATQYTAKDITVLEGLEAVRKRPAMYIGDTNERGLHHLLYEVIDNAIDEAMAGHCDRMVVAFHKDGSASVDDNGRGIPVDKHKGTGLSALEVVLTMLHAGGKFEQKAYHVSGGLHGVGVSVVNALSDWLVATVKRDGKIWRQKFERGKPVGPIESLGKTTERGTLIHFMPDVKPSPQSREGVMEVGEFKYEIIRNRVKELAYLNKGLSIVLRDERSAPALEETFAFEDGLGAFVKELNAGEEVVFPEPFIFHGQIEDLVLDGALQYVQSARECILAFANNINTEEGGTHLEGFKAALTNSLKQYAKDNDLIKEKTMALTGDDVREGLTAVVAVKLPEPQFEGQTKTKLGTSKVKGLVQQIFGDEFYRFLEEKPAYAKAIVNQCLLAARARLEARKAAELVRKSALAGGATLPGKLTDCITRHREEAELFIVEGDSAAGSAKTGRNSQYQAILPIKGKILNVEKATLDRILSNEEIKALITAIGTGINTENRQEYRADKLRYGRIIIMSDADVDGAHIRTLLL